MHSPIALKALRLTALLVVVATLGTWLTTGAHAGWTQTSAVELLQDEVTGIEYPVRRPAFVAGIELLAAGVVAGLTLGALTFIRFRRPAAALVKAPAAQ